MKQNKEQNKQYNTLKKKEKKMHERSETEHKQLTKLEENIKECERAIEKIDEELSKEQEVTVAYFQTKDQLGKAQDTLKKLDHLLTEYNKLEKLRSRYQLIHKQYQEKSKAVVQLQEKYNDLDNKQKEQYAAYMAQQLEEGEACSVCGSQEHPGE